MVHNSQIRFKVMHMGVVVHNSERRDKVTQVVASWRTTSKRVEVVHAGAFSAKLATSI